MLERSNVSFYECWLLGINMAQNIIVFEFEIVMLVYDCFLYKISHRLLMPIIYEYGYNMTFVW